MDWDGCLNIFEEFTEGYILTETPGNAGVLAGSLGSKSRRGRRRSQGLSEGLLFLTRFLKCTPIKKPNSIKNLT